jgi:hypothetical protein
VFLPDPISAIGLYEDPASFFAPADSARTRLIVRQAELEADAWRASLVSGEFDARVGRRYSMRFGFGFPALRQHGEIDYGIGDLRLRATARVVGDTLGASGLFLRSDLRIPTGAEGLRPFCAASLDGGAGIEMRATRGEWGVHAAALYTLVGVRRIEPDFRNDHNLALAASIDAPIPGIASASAAAFVVRYNGGGSREIFLGALRRMLMSRRVVLGVEAAAETGTVAERVFNSSVSVSITYRLPATPHPGVR